MKTKINVNINDTVRVRLTKYGKDIHKEYYKQFPSLPYTKPKEDKDGWSKWTMWELMQIFGKYFVMGSDVPFKTTIEIEVY